MRALVLSTFYGDAANRDKLRALTGLGCEVIAGTPGGAAASDGEVRLMPIGVKGDPDDPATLRWEVGDLRRLLSEQRPDVVQVEDPPESFLAGATATLCERLGIPFVAFSWDAREKPLGILARRRRRRVLERASGVMGGSRRAELLLTETAPSALSIALPQAGIGFVAAVERPARTELAIGFAGRLVPERGLDFLVQALSQTYGHWTLTVLGTGPEQEILEALVERHGLASRVRWWGGVRKELLSQLWEAIDCLVMPSQETADWMELHSPLLVEAMARGIAPVVRDTGVLPELVDGVGPVVKSVEELTEVLQRWVADPAKCRASGARARQHVLQHYVTTAIAKRTLEFWQAVVAERKAVTS